VLAWATPKETVTGAASRAPRTLRGPAAPAGTVRVSAAVGMKGWVAVKATVAGPTLPQVPLTGGEKAGVPMESETAAVKVTVTTWSDGTWVAPVDGVVDATANVGGGAAPPAPPARAALRPAGSPLYRPTAKAPIATAITTTAAPTISHVLRWRVGGGTRI
jgi:hypothetical protein